jgi:hypothetical protein
VNTQSVSFIERGLLRSRSKRSELCSRGRGDRLTDVGIVGWLSHPSVENSVNYSIETLAKDPKSLEPVRLASWLNLLRHGHNSLLSHGHASLLQISVDRGARKKLRSGESRGLMRKAGSG